MTAPRIGVGSVTAMVIAWLLLWPVGIGPCSRSDSGFCGAMAQYPISTAHLHLLNAPEGLLVALVVILAAPVVGAYAIFRTRYRAAHEPPQG